MSSTSISQKKALEERAVALQQRLLADEEQRNHLRNVGRQALDAADTILKSLEMSLDAPEGSALTARAGRSVPLAPIRAARPDSATAQSSAE